ncbi:MAG: hypothetical protein IJ035_00180 [Oscillospiraceae bacterium]|nr:hypothetical protein [Oscillospiraceae bacterium]
MGRNKLVNTLHKMSASKSCANFYFSFDTNFYNLIPLKVSNKLLLAAHDNDFLIDGYKITRLKHIEKVVDKGGKYNEILAFEGINKGIGVPEISIENMRSVCKHFLDKQQYISLEFESKNYEWNFAVGKIVKLTDKHIHFAHFNSMGNWEKKLLKIKYSDIFIIHFGDRYTETFSRHVAPLEAKE